MLRTLEEHAAQSRAQLRWTEFAVSLEPDHSAIQQPFQHHAEVFGGDVPPDGPGPLPGFEDRSRARLVRLSHAHDFRQPLGGKRTSLGQGRRMLSLVAEQAHDVRLNADLKLREGIGNAFRRFADIAVQLFDG